MNDSVDFSKIEAGKLAIVAMTANAMAGDRDRCLEAVVDDDSPKPIRPDVVESTIARWCRPSADRPA